MDIIQNYGILELELFVKWLVPGIDSVEEKANEIALGYLNLIMFLEEHTETNWRHGTSIQEPKL